MKETDLQFHIKQSVIKQGGYCKKLTNRFTIGIPDLLIALPPFAPCVAEVKEMGDVKGRFDRQIGISPKQTHELRQINIPYVAVEGDLITPSVGFIFVGYCFEGERRLAALRPLEVRMDYDVKLWTPREVGNFYDIKMLMENLGVAKVRRAA